MSQEDWDRFQTKLSGVFYAWCFVGLIAGIFAVIYRWYLR